ncbi:MAG: LptE family protein [Bacteroidota bacterium]|jgi:Lipopolysaccharide-assembly
MMRLLRLTVVLVLALLSFSEQSCGIYSFTGGRKFDDSVTVSVATFTNTASLAKPTVPQTVSEALRDAIQRQTRLNFVSGNADLDFSGEITGYSVAPVALQGGGATDQAQLNRLTITVSVNYVDKIEEQYSFESSFTRFADFPAASALSTVEDALIKEITDQLVQDIMNRSINAW